MASAATGFFLFNQTHTETKPKKSKNQELERSESKLNISSREVAGELIKMLLPSISHIYHLSMLTKWTLIL